MAQNKVPPELAVTIAVGCYHSTLKPLSETGNTCEYKFLSTLVMCVCCEYFSGNHTCQAYMWTKGATSQSRTKKNRKLMNATEALAESHEVCARLRLVNEACRGERDEINTQVCGV